MTGRRGFRWLSRRSSSAGSPTASAVGRSPNEPASMRVLRYRPASAFGYLPAPKFRMPCSPRRWHWRFGASCEHSTRKNQGRAGGVPYFGLRSPSACWAVSMGLVRRGRRTVGLSSVGPCRSDATPAALLYRLSARVLQLLDDARVLLNALLPGAHFADCFGAGGA